MELGHTVGWIEDNMSANELSEWIAFCNVREKRRKRQERKGNLSGSMAPTLENFEALLGK